MDPGAGVPNGMDSPDPDAETQGRAAQKRLMLAAVLILLLLVGGTFVLIAVIRGNEQDTEDGRGATLAPSAVVLATGGR